ncbi:glutathione S-transferase [Moraxella nasovis]|uniref:glutathione S-transferase n=1 Tax=Moraxella nasovis TaxID=2904121 RepID=UPI001F61B9BE|nr:glutathione S-transferase [Moraxella nasovis]UNU73402.1 glutathione S-transferase [Moraxella nasovis]
MITLHHLNNSRSFRILWLLEELGLPYTLVKHTRTKSYLAPKAMQKTHFMGKAPILTDGEKTLIESGFIIEYLLRHYDKTHKLKPSDDQTWEQFCFWLHFTEGSLMPNLVMRLVFDKITTQSPFFVRPITKQIQQKIEKLYLNDNITNSLSLLDQTLQNQDYVSGDVFSAADIQVHFAISAMQNSSSLPMQSQSIKEWQERCESREAYQRAVLKDS